MFDGGAVTPDDLVTLQPEDGRDSIPLRGTGEPAALGDGHNTPLVELSLFRELLDSDAVLSAQLCNGTKRVHGGFSFICPPARVPKPWLENKKNPPGIPKANSMERGHDHV
jgi:hypothetical protein